MIRQLSGVVWAAMLGGAMLGAAVLGAGCDGGGGGTDAGTRVDSGTAIPVGTGFGRYRPAIELVEQEFCDCFFADEGFASAAACATFGELPQTSACEQQAFTASAGAADPAFDCLAPIYETFVACLAAAACDEDALGACDEAAGTAADACPETPTAYTEPLVACITSDVIGTTASTCPENGTASSATGSSVFTGTTVGAGDDLDGCEDGTIAPDRVFQWTATAAGTYDIDTTGSAFDTVLYILDACTGGTEIACNDDAAEEDIGFLSRAQITLTAGQTIFIVVDGYEVAAGTFQININPGTPPADAGVPVSDAGPPASDAGVPPAGDAGP